MSVVESIPTTAGSGAAKIHVSPLERVRDSSKVNMFCALSKERVYGPFFFMETTITGIVHLDMLKELLIPQLDEDNQEGRIHFLQDGAPIITLEKCASTSTPVSQVGG